MPSNRRSQARTIADLARLVLCMVGGVRLLAVPKALTTQAKTTTSTTTCMPRSESSC